MVKKTIKKEVKVPKKAPKAVKAVKVAKGIEKAIKEAEVIAEIKTTKAKELAAEGLNAKEIARDLGIDKYEASKLVKG